MVALFLSPATSIRLTNSPVKSAPTYSPKSLEKSSPILRNTTPAAEAELRVIGIGTSRLMGDICRGSRAGIILAGVAGGLDPLLRIGEVIVDQPEAGPWPRLPFRRGKIYTSQRLVASVAEKAELFRRTGALAVDMESAPVARFAAEVGVPLLVIRAISDGAADAISPRVLWWIDEFGRPRLRRTVAGLAGNPLLIPGLIRLGRRSQEAAQAMVGAVRLALAPVARGV